MVKFLQGKKVYIHGFIVWVIPIIMGLFMASIDGKRNWIGGFLGYSALLLFSSLAIEFTCRGLQTNQKIYGLGFGIFWFRLLIGIGMMGLLPMLGYQDSEVSQAGYIYQDAYNRDSLSWDLASSGQSLGAAFGGDSSGDQYGGLFWLSAATYRYLSPGYHRPLLLLIWIALAGAISTVVFWRAVLDWLERTNQDASSIALIGTFIFAFYPEAVLLGSSHMREAIVLLGAVMMFRGFVLLTRSNNGWLLWLGGGGFLLLVFQAPVGVAYLLVLLGLWLLEPQKKANWKTTSVFMLLILITTVGSILVFTNLPSLVDAKPVEVFQVWLARNFNFQSHLSERSSGMLQKLLDSTDGKFLVPIVIGYGFVQPVLPAALVDPAAPIWWVINVLRALGWYLLAPLILYGTLTVFNKCYNERRWQRLWLSLVCIGWIIIAAANAGGDQWDNPRYRTLFIPWMALLAAWVWILARQHKDLWAARFLVVSGLFSLAFLEWYLSRYFPGLIHLDIRIMILFTFCIIGCYLLGSLVWDYRKRKKNL